MRARRWRAWTGPQGGTSGLDGGAWKEADRAGPGSWGGASPSQQPGLSLLVVGLDDAPLERAGFGVEPARENDCGHLAPGVALTLQNLTCPSGKWGCWKNSGQPRYTQHHASPPTLSWLFLKLMLSDPEKFKGTRRFPVSSQRALFKKMFKF